MKYRQLFFLLFLVHCTNAFGQDRVVKDLESWKFHKGENEQAFQTDFDDQNWQAVTVPHDWAIYGPFDKEIDKQTVKIEQNNEEEATEKTGRTGAVYRGRLVQNILGAS